MAFTAICSNYEAFRLVVLWHLECFVAFMGHWGWTLVLFTALIVFIGHQGWTFVVFYSVCSVYGALALYVWHLGLV